MKAVMTLLPLVVLAMALFAVSSIQFDWDDDDDSGGYRWDEDNGTCCCGCSSAIAALGVAAPVLLMAKARRGKCEEAGREK